MKIMIDFDRTICPDSDLNNNPSIDCINTICRLKEEGHEIIIWSVRSNLEEMSNDESHLEMIDYLKTHKIPYDSIDCNKPYFNLIIDDRCCGIWKNDKGDVDWSIIKNKI